MAQVTIYLPDDLVDRLRRRAKKAKKSLSAYVAELATAGHRDEGWPAGFAALYGSCDGEMPDVEEPPLDEVELG